MLNQHEVDAFTPFIDHLVQMAERESESTSEARVLVADVALAIVIHEQDFISETQVHDTMICQGLFGDNFSIIHSGGVDDDMTESA